MPLISVIVPVYKVEAYLPACVDSILAQTFCDFELILVDDGSPDACGEMCDQYARQDARIRVIHQENGGLSAARNAGLEIAQGNYITFVDSDDIISEDCLSCMQKIADETNADLVVGRYIEFAIEDDRIRNWKQDAAAPAHHMENRQEVCIGLYQGKQWIPINACGKLYRKSVIGDLRFPKGRIHEDQAFVPIAAYRASHIEIMDKAIYGYRCNDEGITHSTFSNRRYDDIWAVDQCIAFFEDNGEAQIMDAAKIKRKVILAKYAILARRAGVMPPEEYRMPICRAICCLKKNVSPERFEYYMGLVHPKLPLICAYARKIKRSVKGEGKA